MNNLRTYGVAPFNIALVHGGPGAPGEMAPVARELASEMGVLEPLQTAGSIEGQVEELKDVLETHCNPPLVLVGFSWGAWLSFIFAAQYPSLVKKLVLISSPPFTDKYVPQIMETRLSHLSAEERQEALSLLSSIYSGSARGNSFARFGDLMEKADSFAPLPHEDEILPCSPAIYQQVWAEASKMRSSGELLQLGEKIRCPVVAFHGDYDPHPAAGVREPLSRILTDFRFMLLANCGHHPWFEREAKDNFYAELRREIGAYE
ncbi:MAG: alpha/beta hydrolase [Dehalococcoidales bacterium]|jgi:pimeloyl-ACP methyl ester carboxylesterase